MVIGYINPGQCLIREYQDIALRVRLLSLFEGDTPVGHRVEVRKGGELGEYESELFGLGFEQFNMAMGAFKGHVLPMVDL
jgi:hypothetical protein